jgi:hypothetical protein
MVVIFSQSLQTSRFRLLARVPRRRQSDITGECDAERACGAVADAFRNFGDATIVLPEHILRQGHAPSEQILHRSDPHRAAEPLEERRTRERGLLRQLRDRPRLRRAFVHPSYRHGEAFVCEPAHEAGRRCGACRRAERFDENSLEETGEDDLARRAPFAMSPRCSSSANATSATEQSSS